MNQYILTLSVGPVQGFIASARRSRDLWCGSWLLSEIAKAAAKDLSDKGATLIFPAVDADNQADLEPDSDFSVGNKIQVQCSCADAAAVNQLAKDAAEAAKQRFREIAQTVWDELGNDTHHLRQEIWDKQVNDYVEVQYAWAQIEDSNYAQACKQAARLLAARKSTRDFVPTPVRCADDADYMLPKSSLDGARETVLKESDKLSKGLRGKLGLNRSEQLDCAGMVKRLGGKIDQFTPITRVAADTWLCDLYKKDKNKLKELADKYESLVKCGLATRVSGNQSAYQDFPYDAQFLYRSRLEAALLKADNDEKQALRELKQVVQPIWKEYGEPSTYWVMLLADGDRMGALLDKADSLDKHQQITRALSDFAGNVPNIVRENRGHCIYAGGDDVLALLPLDAAVNCAKVLKDDFAKKLADVAKQLNVDESEYPSLSAGLAICHIQTPLGNVRALAKRAEKVAKGDGEAKSLQRNALGLTLSVRSGSDVDWRMRWDDDHSSDALKDWIQAYRQKTLSSRIAYDCRQIFLMTDFPVIDEKVDLQAIRAAELTRMLAKARSPQGGELDKALAIKLQARFNALQAQHADKALGLLADELIITRWLAAKTKRDLGEQG